jgi:proline dehydrogenase
MKTSRKLLGKNLFSLLMKSTFYGHFVAGENQIMIKPTIENLMKYNVRSILDYSVEDDLDSAQGKNEEEKFDKNMEIFVDCIDSVVSKYLNELYWL